MPHPQKVNVWIECPECKKVQEATIALTKPFLTYIHFCEECKHIITESDWNEIECIITKQPK